MSRWDRTPAGTSYGCAFCSYRMGAAALLEHIRDEHPDEFNHGIAQLLQFKAACRQLLRVFIARGKQL